MQNQDATGAIRAEMQGGVQGFMPLRQFNLSFSSHCARKQPIKFRCAVLDIFAAIHLTALATLCYERAKVCLPLCAECAICVVRDPRLEGVGNRDMLDPHGGRRR
jgi:hypothetical protein